LVANNGMLQFSGISGLTNVINNASSITATGTITNLNNALNGLVYTSNAGYVGNDVVQLIVSDNNAAV